MGWRNFFFSCAVVSFFWLWQKIVSGVNQVPVLLLCQFFWLLQEIVFGSTVSKKDSYCVSSIEKIR
jgi:hypothetical protein